VAGPLALERGRALGEGRRGAAVASLLSEPLVRLLVGLPATASLGGTGAAAGVVAGGYVALLSARVGPARSGGAAAPPMATAGAASAFLLLAIVQNQDVVWSGALLGPVQAGRFAVLSTLGGMVAFATATVPLVLLPRARRGERGALTVALLAATLLGAGALLPTLVDARALVTTVFGARYAPVAPLAAPYLLAMGLLGVARVLVAQRCASSSPRALLVGLAGCAALQASLIAVIGHDAAGVAHSTLITCGALCAASVLAAVLDAPQVIRGRVASPRRVSQPAAPPPPRIDSVRPARRRAPAVGLAIAALTLAGLGLRMAAGRSLWLDEATSVTQARMGFGAMLHNLRTTDVQPPLHDAILWVLNRLFGDSALAMRSPSLVAGSVLIPVLYGLGRDLFDRRTGVIAAVLATFAPFVVWYSQEARMYALFMLFAALALWGQVLVLQDRRPPWVGWALYTVATIALCWTQYFTVLFVAVQQAAFLAVAAARPERRRALLGGWVISALMIAACVAPLLPFAYHQFIVNQNAGRGFGAPSQNGTDLEAGHTTPTVYAFLTNVVWGLWGYHSAGTMAAVTAMWPLGILLVLAALGRGRSWPVALLLALVLVPIGVLYLVGQEKPFLFEIRYFCGGVPVALLLLARMCARWAGPRPLGAALMCAALSASFLGGFVDQQYSQTNPRLYDFQGALGRISREFRRGDVLVYQPYYLNDLVAYYTRGLASQPLGSNVARLAPHGEVFVMASFQQGAPQNVRAVRAGLSALRAAHRRQVQAFDLPQVQVWVFR
jgi:hypothetical protein